MLEIQAEATSTRVCYHIEVYTIAVVLVLVAIKFV